MCFTSVCNGPIRGGVKVMGLGGNEGEKRL